MNLKVGDIVSYKNYEYKTVISKIIGITQIGGKWNYVAQLKNNQQVNFRWLTCIFDIGKLQRICNA